MRRAYLDHAASTPIAPAALDAMLPYLDGRFANPSGVYRDARAARRAIDDARDAVASFARCAPGEVIFTSGGTESDNLALQGAALRQRGAILVSAVEHDAVRRPAERLGAEVVPVSADCRIDLDALEQLLRPDTTLVSTIAVQSEVGALQPLAQVRDLVRSCAPTALLHTDAVQAAPFLEPECWDGFDLVSLSGHKIGGPKGSGALIVRTAARGRLAPLQLGGGQELELRAGTENVAAIVGLGAAAACRDAERSILRGRVESLRDALEAGLREAVPWAVITEVVRRSPGHLHVRFPGLVAEELLIVLDELGLDASAGSACASGALEPSHALEAMGWTEVAAREAVRFSLGWSTTRAEIDVALRIVPDAIARLRGSVAQP